MRNRLILGALGGALGGLAMKAVVRFVDPASFGLSAATDAKTAHEVWHRMGWPPITDKQAEGIGAAMHYAFGVGAGAVYAASEKRFPLLAAGGGTWFGALLWLVGDEVAVSAAGLEDPRRAPMFSHASALGAHILYGLAVSLVLREPGSRERHHPTGVCSGLLQASE